MVMRKVVASTVTTLRTDTAVVTGVTPSAYVWVKWEVANVGADVALKYKLWKDGTSEPGSWATAYTDIAPTSTFTGPGRFQINTQPLAGFTGTYPYLVNYDDLSITSIGGGGSADTTPPTVPTGLSATANGPARVDLAWTASTDAVGVQGYKIYRGGTYLTTTASTTFADTGLSPSTLYSYTVSAIDGAGNASAQTIAQTATTAVASSDTTAPTVPTAVTATAVSSSRIDVSWGASNDDTGVQGYRVYRDGSLTATIGSTSYFDTGQASSTAHSYTVAAFDTATNASLQSSSASATTQGPPVRTTTFAYDVLDRLTTETPAGGTASTFSLDALGRHATRTTGGTTETYGYLGTTASVVQIASSANPTSPTNAAIDAIGSRIAVSAGSTVGWTLPDLHGDVAGYANAGLTAVSDAFRYDPYGGLIDQTTSSTPSPWRYQGKLLENGGTGTSDLYDFGFRSYAPGLGAFTSLDDVMGSAQNPLTLNRFLYAQANPETLVDPDGHNPFCAAAAVATSETGPGALAVFGVCELAAIVVFAAATEATAVLAANVIRDADRGPLGALSTPQHAASTTSTTETLRALQYKTAAQVAASRKPRVTDSGPSQIIRSLPKIDIGNNENFPLPPPRGCLGSGPCRAAVTILALITGATTLSGVSTHQQSEGDTPVKIRDDIQEREYQHHQGPSIRPARGPSVHFPSRRVGRTPVYRPRIWRPAQSTGLAPRAF